MAGALDINMFFFWIELAVWVVVKHGINGHEAKVPRDVPRNAGSTYWKLIFLFVSDKNWLGKTFFQQMSVLPCQCGPAVLLSNNYLGG